jgi:hypothetical protein
VPPKFDGEEHTVARWHRNEQTVTLVHRADMQCPPALTTTRKALFNVEAQKLLASIVVALDTTANVLDESLSRLQADNEHGQVLRSSLLGRRADQKTSWEEVEICCLQFEYGVSLQKEISRLTPTDAEDQSASAWQRKKLRRKQRLQVATDDVWIQMCGSYTQQAPSKSNGVTMQTRAYGPTGQ